MNSNRPAPIPTHKKRSTPISAADRKLFDISPEVRDKALNNPFDKTDSRDCPHCKLQLTAIAGGWECQNNKECNYVQSLLKPSASA